MSEQAANLHLRVIFVKEKDHADKDKEQTAKDRASPMIVVSHSGRGGGGGGGTFAGGEGEPEEGVCKPPESAWPSVDAVSERTFTTPMTIKMMGHKRSNE